MTLRLFTPGPLTTDPRVRAAMAHDWGSRDAEFADLTRALREGLLSLANGTATHAAVPLQGPGTYALEAMAATLIGPTHKVLVLVNGAYGRRFAAIAARLGRAAVSLEWPEDAALDPSRVAEALGRDGEITHIALAHCETTTGVVNPVEPIAALASRAGKTLLLDAMSSFGALPLDLAQTPIGALASSSNKCLEGPPGVSFVLVERSLLLEARGRSPSLSLDLADQNQGFEANGQWRFTPPVQVVAGLVEALRLLDAEGGPPARLRRYRLNLERLTAGLGGLGYRLYLDPAVQGPIIATFRPKEGTRFDFEALYQGLAKAGLIIYPGKLTGAETFRIGCIGALTDEDFVELIEAFKRLSKAADDGLGGSLGAA